MYPRFDKIILYSSGWKSFFTLSFLDCFLKDSAESKYEYFRSHQIKTKPFWGQSSRLVSFNLSLYLFWLKCGLCLLKWLETSFTFSVPNCFLRDSAKHLGKVLILMKSSNQNKTFLSAKLSSNDKLPQGLSLIATSQGFRYKICGNMWNILNPLASKQTFTGCKASSLLSQIPLYPHSLRVWPALHRGEMVALEFLQIQLDI